MRSIPQAIIIMPGTLLKLILIRLSIGIRRLPTRKMRKHSAGLDFVMRRRRVLRRTVTRRFYCTGVPRSRGMMRRSISWVTVTGTCMVWRKILSRLPHGIKKLLSRDMQKPSTLSRVVMRREMV